ncbi:MAG: hypothetical protein JWM87_1202 [Candidatus Eremiobacteraeota bacterium]|nr:hypothetical protein [Candidatus Eremiobacteraeota bacterium]
MTPAFVARAAVVLVAGLLPGAVFAAPATPPGSAAAPLRSVTFQIEFTSKTEERVQTSGIQGHDSMTGGGAGAAGGGSWRTLPATSGAAKGTITVDVIAVTGDGLVVDIAETADQRNAPKTRIGISTKGRLVYDVAKATVNEEEIMLLQLLNRALVEGHDNDGVTWTDDLSVHGFKDVTTYRILSSTDVKPGPVLHMELERSVSASAGHPFEMTATGKFDYNEQRAIPLDVTLRERRTSVVASGRQQQVDAVYTYKLVADSLSRT